jgi:hypothetical protein
MSNRKFIHIKAEFGSNYYLVTERGNGLTQCIFICKGSLYFGSVEKGNSRIEGGSEEFNCVVLTSCRAVSIT